MHYVLQDANIYEPICNKVISIPGPLQDLPTLRGEQGWLFYTTARFLKIRKNFMELGIRNRILNTGSESDLLTLYVRTCPL